MCQGKSRVVAPTVSLWRCFPSSTQYWTGARPHRDASVDLPPAPAHHRRRMTGREPLSPRAQKPSGRHRRDSQASSTGCRPCISRPCPGPWREPRPPACPSPVTHRPSSVTLPQRDRAMQPRAAAATADGLGRRRLRLAGCPARSARRSDSDAAVSYLRRQQRAFERLQRGGAQRSATRAANRAAGGGAPFQQIPCPLLPRLHQTPHHQENHMGRRSLAPAACSSSTHTRYTQYTTATVAVRSGYRETAAVPSPAVQPATRAQDRAPPPV